MSNYTDHYTYYNNLTDAELLEIIDENYYGIGATGVDALENLLADIGEGVWERHGVPVSRMNRITVMLVKSFNDRQVWNVVAGLVTDAQRKQMTRRPRRSILMRKR